MLEQFPVHSFQRSDEARLRSHGRPYNSEARSEAFRLDSAGAQRRKKLWQREMPMGERNVGRLQRVDLLLGALGIDPESLRRFLEWALCEHLVVVISQADEIGTDFFAKTDALRRFRAILKSRTGRAWSQHDLDALFERVKTGQQQHYRSAVPYEEYLKLLWQVPLECSKCHRRPPAIVLHIDHIVPASLGGKSARPNLQFLCSEDNLKKSNQREVSGPWLDLL
jgi:hypothetical protein